MIIFLSGRPASVCILPGTFHFAVHREVSLTFFVSHCHAAVTNPHTPSLVATTLSCCVLSNVVLGFDADFFSLFCNFLPRISAFTYLHSSSFKPPAWPPVCIGYDRTASGKRTSLFLTDSTVSLPSLLLDMRLWTIKQRNKLLDFIFQVVHQYRNVLRSLNQVCCWSSLLDKRFQ